MAQIQCPNCGVYKIISPTGIGKTYLIYGGALLVLTFLFGQVGFIFLFPAIYMFYVAFVGLSKLKYKCTICGFRFEDKDLLPQESELTYDQKTPSTDTTDVEHPIT